jgi:CHAT domain-containing protein/tetratricopeptide (TPR) repeat protein
MRMRWLALFVLMAAAPSPGATPPIRTIEQSVRGFYTAWASGNVNAAAGFWTRAEAKGFIARTARTLQTRCLVLHQLDVAGVEIEGHRAKATVDALITLWSAMPGAIRETQRQRATVVLQLEDGEWRVTSWRRAEDELAEQLLKATEGERAALLQGDRAPRTRYLVEVLSRQAVSLLNQDQPARAAEILAIARDVATELNDVAAMAQVLGAESIRLRLDPFNDYPASLREARAATALAEQSGDPDTLARTLTRLGRAEFVTGQGDAMASCERVMALEAFLEDPSLPALAASQLARIYDGRPRDALRYAMLASAWAEKAGDPAAIISAEMNITGVYMGRADWELAIPHIQKAVELAEKAGYSGAQADLLEALASCYYRLGSGKRFLELTGRALELLGNDGAVLVREDILIRRGEYFVEHRDYLKAETELFQASALFPRARDPVQENRFNYVMALLRARQLRYEEANQHLALVGGGWEVALLRARVLEVEGRSAEARCELEEAIELIEWYRSDMAQERQRSLYLSATSSIYVQLIENLAAAGETREALTVAERLKARTLKDRVGRITESGMRGDGSVERSSARVVELNRRLLAIQHDGGNTVAIRQQLRRARGELDEAVVQTDRARPATLPAPESGPQNLPGLQAFDVPPRTTVIEYVVGEERTTAFVIHSDGAFPRVKMRTIAVSEKVLRRRVAQLVRAIELRDGKYRPASRRLYDLLLRPLIGARPAGDALCLIPDGVLWTLPFQALIDAGGRHVVERVPLFYAPSLAMLSAGPPVTRALRTPTVLAMGDPEIDADTKNELHAVRRDAALGRLPDAAREVHALRALYGRRASVRTGPEATESTLKRDAGQFDVVHLATHGLVDDRWPMYSALLLAGSENEDGLLEAREILSLPLHAELVVLSACDTARGPILGGEGMVGLSWAVLAAGSPRAIATQWSVGSASAARLMIAFHRRLAKQSSVQNVSLALRAAQLEILRRPMYAHPYYWAGFILVGREP